MDFFEKLNKLPKDVRDFFSSNEPRIHLETACFLYGIDEKEIKKISETIAQIFLKEVSLDKLPLMIEREFNVNSRVASGIAYEMGIRMFVQFNDYFTDYMTNAKTLLKKWEQNKIQPIVSKEKAWQQVLDIEPWILEQEKEKEQAEAAAKEKTDSLNLVEALNKYPKLGEQEVSVNLLKLRYLPQPVRPSIKNWITDFHDNMGAGKHGAVDRGNYIFHSENGRKLTPAERQKLSLILKSLDENSPLAVDPEAQKIIFQEKNSFQAGFSGRSNIAGGYGRGEEQKDIFQRSDWLKPMSQGFFSSRKNEALKKEIPKEESPKNENTRSDYAIKKESYSQIQETKPNIDIRSKEEADQQESRLSATNNNYSPNFRNVATISFPPKQKIAEENQEEKLSFSSPQKLPAEKEAEIANKAETKISQPEASQTMPVQKDVIAQPPKQIDKIRWTIKPSTYSSEEENESGQSSLERAKKNVVDLR